MSFLSLSTKTRVVAVGDGGTKVFFRGLVELIKRSDEVEDAEVMLSVSKKDEEDDEEVEERELGLEVEGEIITSGVERGEGNAFMGMSMKNLSRGGVGDIMAFVEIMAKSSSASCLSSDSSC